MFKSEILQESFQKAQSNLSNFQKRLNEMSEDIKSLENYLKNQNICIDFAMECFVA